MYATKYSVAGLFDAAAGAAERLADVLGHGPDAAGVAAAFDELAAALAALPPNPAVDVYLRNTTEDAAALHAAGEFGAARWQVEQLARRLRRLRGEWAGDAVRPARGTRHRA